MTHSNIFDAPHLTDYLENAIARNCGVEVQSDGKSFLRWKRVSGISVLSGLAMASILPGQLSQLTRGDGEIVTRDLLSRRMVEVAILASHAGVAVSGPRGSEEQCAQLRRRLNIDFALNCALALAYDREYVVTGIDSLWASLHSVLTVKADDLLRRIFFENLIPRTSVSHPAQPEWQRSREATRVITPQSYWNLMAEKELNGWSDPVCLRLIEEVMSPAPQHRAGWGGGTHISGSDWRDLYKSIFGELRAA